LRKENHSVEEKAAQSVELMGAKLAERLVVLTVGPLVGVKVEKTEFLLVAMLAGSTVVW
jgi:hypothetical protein